MAHNKLKLNEVKKTDILICVPSSQTHKCSINSLTIGGKVEASDSVRNLRVMFARCIQMNATVNSVVKSCYHQLRNIGNIRKYVSTEDATNLIMLLLAAD